MVPFDVMTGRNSMVCNNRGMTDLCKSFEMLGLPFMQSSFCLTDVEGITVPTTGFVYYKMKMFVTAVCFLFLLDLHLPFIAFLHNNIWRSLVSVRTNRR